MKLILRLIAISIVLVSCHAAHGQGSSGKKGKNQQTTTPIDQVFFEYDVKNDLFTQRPSFIKEGSSVIIRYKNVNKYALNPNASIVSGNRSYADGLSVLQEGLQQLGAAKDKAKEEVKEQQSDSLLDSGNEKG